MGDGRILHCWQDRRSDIEERFGFGSPEWVESWADDWANGTCMLRAGHEGVHDFTPDTEIGVSFARSLS